MRRGTWGRRRAYLRTLKQKMGEPLAGGIFDENDQYWYQNNQWVILQRLVQVAKPYRKYLRFIDKNHFICETFKSLWWSTCPWAFRYIKILKLNNTWFIEKLLPVIDFELKKSSYLNKPYTACQEGSDPLILLIFSKLLSELWISKFF